MVFISRLLDFVNKTHLRVYLVYGFTAKVLPFLSVVIFAHLLSPYEFGIVAAFLAIISIASSLYGFGFKQMIHREQVYLDRLAFSQLISSGLAVSSLVQLVVFAILLVCYVAGVNPVIDFVWIVIALAIALIASFIEVIEKLMVVFQKSSNLGRIQLLKGGGALLFSVLLVLSFSDEGVEARIYGQVLGLILAFIIAVVFARSVLTATWPAIFRMKEVFFYGLKVVPQIVANWIKMGADKLIIASVLSLSEMGIYSLVFAACSIFMVLVEAANNYYSGQCMALYKEKQLKRLKAIRRRLTGFTFIFAIIFFVVLLYLFDHLFPQTYSVSYQVIMMMTFSFYLQMIYLLYAKFFLFQEQMSLLGGVNLLAMFVYVGGIYWFESSLTIEKVAMMLVIYNILISGFVMLYAYVGEYRMLGNTQKKSSSHL